MIEPHEEHWTQDDCEYRARFWRIAIPLSAFFVFASLAGIIIATRGW